ncbi:MAG: SemiSWEET transporter [Bacteroidales bacterium]|nr:SemiSWEET transporter [Bacteroidales bacterium]
MNPEIVGMCAGLLSCVTFIPQVIKTYRTKSTDDVSLWMFVLASLGTILWLAYGFLIDSISILFTNFVVLGLSLIMLFFFYRFRPSKA